MEADIASIFDWSSTAASNTTIDSIGCNTGMSPGNVDNVLRSMAAIIRQTFSSALQTFLAGTAGLGVASGGTGVQTLTGVPKGNGTAAMSAIANASPNAKQFLRDDYTFAAPLEAIVVYITDEATTVTTGTSKRTLFMPYAFTLVSAFAAVTTQSSSGVVTVDVNLTGSTIFSTNPSIAASADTNLSSGTAAALSTTAVAQGGKLTFDVDAAGTGAKGLHVIMIGRQA